jgi:DNA-binding MarR family transcriptional regulator
MTNIPQSTHLTNRQAFKQLLRQHGVEDLHGLELMRLAHMIAHTYEHIIDEELSHARLSGPRWGLLLRLWGAEKLGHASVRPTQLSLAQNVSKNTISSHLRSLEDQGLIEREIDQDDKRQFRIRLSDAGRAVVEATMPNHLEFLNTLTAELTRAEIEQLQHLMFRLFQSLVKHGNLEGRCSYIKQDE